MYKPSFFNPVQGTPVPNPKEDEPDFSPKDPPLIKPNEKRQSGRFPRYFLQHKTSRVLYEISLKTYEELRRRSDRYDYRIYNFIQLEWDSTLPKEDTYYGKYRKEGSNTKNLKQVRLLEEKIPGLEEYLKTMGELL
jgi:hypothetical protein